MESKFDELSRLMKNSMYQNIPFTHFVHCKYKLVPDRSLCFCMESIDHHNNMNLFYLSDNSEPLFELKIGENERCLFYLS